MASTPAPPEGSPAPATAPVGEPEPEPVPETVPVQSDPRLASLENGFQSAYEREANRPFLAAVEELGRNYLGALERARRTARQAGSLDDVTALDEEASRMADGKGPPPADDPGTPASLVSLRQTYRSVKSKLELERGERTAPLYDKYLSALDVYESELTRANEIEKALDVRRFRGQIETRKNALRDAALAIAEEPGPGMTSGTAAPPPVTPDASGRKVEIITSSPYRELATWILSEGGFIRIRKDESETDFRPENAADLPNGRFDIVQARLGPPKSGSLTDEDFSRFVGARELRSLTLVGCPLATLPALREMDFLESVHIEKCPRLADEFLVDLGSRPALKSLHLQWDEGTQPAFGLAAFQGLAASSSLEKVNLTGFSLKDEFLAELAKIPSLTNLQIPRTGSLDGSFFEAFGQHPRLEGLSLAYFGEGFELSRIAALADAPSFRSLVANVWQSNPEALRAYGRISQLESLHFNASTSVTEADLSNLSGLGKLARLEIGGLANGGTAFRSFTCGETLRLLRLQSSLIDAEGLAAIAETFAVLEDLTLESDRLENEDLVSCPRNNFSLKLREAVVE